MEENFIGNLFEDFNKKDNNPEENLEVEKKQLGEPSQIDDSSPARESSKEVNSTESDSEVASHEPPEIPHNAKVMINRFDREINSTITNCNNLDRDIRNTLKQSSIIQENIYDMMAQESEMAVINKLITILSKCNSTMILASSYTQNIKASQERNQRVIDMYNEEFEE